MNNKKTICQHRIKLIAGFGLFTKVQTDFLSSCFIYELNGLKHATNHTQTRCMPLKKQD